MKHFVIFITIAFLIGCKQELTDVSKIESKLLPINSDLGQVDSITAYIAPYKKRVNEVLDSTLAYAPKMISKDDGEYNTTAGNLLADIIMSEANPIFKSTVPRCQ